MYKLAVIYPPTSIFNCKNFSGSYTTGPPLIGGWEGRGGEGREGKGREGEGLKEGKVASLILEGWTPLTANTSRTAYL
jgi:hypothetical protein